MLTTEQIKIIDAYFEEKKIHFYDIRRELVDHVSQSIEQKMKLDPTCSFESVLEEEKKKFTDKDLAVLYFEAITTYDTLKEWKYFTAKRIFYFLITYIILIIPIFFIANRYMVFLEIVYLIITIGIYLNILISFRKQYPLPGKKISNYIPETNFGWIFPVVYITYRVICLFSKPTITTKDPPTWLFFLLTFGLLFLLMGLLAKINYKKSEYLKAKQQYPFLFNS